MVAHLAEQAETLKAAQLKVKTMETGLLAEFEIERSVWADKEAQMTVCFSSIEDLVDGKPHSLGFVVLNCQPLLIALAFFFFRPDRLLPGPFCSRDPNDRGPARGAKGGGCTDRR